MNRRAWVVAGVIVLIGIAVVIGRHDDQQTSTTATGTSTGYLTMPDYRGQVVSTALADLRGALGQQTSVSAPGGAAAMNQIITGTAPAAGALVNSATEFVFYTGGSTSSGGTSSGGVSGGSAGSGGYSAATSGQVGQGTYIVGQDIQPGTYRTTGSEAQGQIICNWFRLRDTTGDASANIAFGNATGPTVMTVKPTDGAVEFQGGCTWTRS